MCSEQRLSERQQPQGGTMKVVSENFKDLHALYVHQLRTLLSAEEQLIRSLPDMANRAVDEELQQVFWSHQQETELHVKRLEEVLANIKRVDHSVSSIGPIKCKAMHGLIEEMEDLMEDARDPFVKDAALIAAAQRVEHYEIGAYGAVRQFAWVLGENAAAEILDMTLKEEGQADHLMTSIAERINVHAKHAHTTAA
jgi:ferritin-like metal-binding protein YciE